MYGLDTGTEEGRQDGPLKSLGPLRNVLIFQRIAFFNEDNIKLIRNTLESPQKTYG